MSILDKALVKCSDVHCNREFMKFKCLSQDLKNKECERFDLILLELGEIIIFSKDYSGYYNWYGKDYSFKKFSSICHRVVIETCNLVLRCDEFLPTARARWPGPAIPPMVTSLSSPYAAPPFHLTFPFSRPVSTC